MALIEVQRFNFKTRKLEPALVNADFIVEVRQRDTPLGVMCALHVIPSDDEWMLVKHELQDIKNRVGTALDSEYVSEIDLGQLAKRTKQCQW